MFPSQSFFFQTFYLPMSMWKRAFDWKFSIWLNTFTLPFFYMCKSYALLGSIIITLTLYCSFLFLTMIASIDCYWRIFHAISQSEEMRRASGRFSEAIYSIYFHEDIGWLTRGRMKVEVGAKEMKRKMSQMWFLLRLRRENVGQATKALSIHLLSFQPLELWFPRQLFFPFNFTNL